LFHLPRNKGAFPKEGSDQRGARERKEIMSRELLIDPTRKVTERVEYSNVGEYLLLLALTGESSLHWVSWGGPLPKFFVSGKTSP